MSPADFQQVRSVPLFAGLPDTKLAFLERGEMIEMPAGSVLVAEGETNCFFYVVIEGEVRITRAHGIQSILLKVNKPGNYMGEITLLLGVAWIATARVTKPSRLFRLNEEGFWLMMNRCDTIGRTIFSAAASRVRTVEGQRQQQEKLISLGTMAAGLAHELNNPAAAARRAIIDLQETSDRAHLFICGLSRFLDSGQWQHLLNAALGPAKGIAPAPVSDHLARSDREDALAQWLEARDVAFAWDFAPTFVQAGMDSVALGEIIEKLPPASQADALGWLACRLNLKSLVSQADQSTGRIVELVKAVKSYSYMDQSPMQEVDIHEGIESTLTMLGCKLGKVTLVRAFNHSLPRILAYGSELNQVWTNLIDNAIDAVNGSGRIWISTCLEDSQVIVEIADDGPGIPPEVQSRLFEPFFTTKPVGSGTGLGLVISNRIIGDRHGGEIEFDSRPGQTRFKVRLPINRERTSV